MKFTNQTFTDETINLDGNEFEDCSFDHCVLIYEGGLTSLIGCRFALPKFTFSGAAGQTLFFLTKLHVGGAGELVELLFDDIRKGVFGDDDILSSDILD